MLVFSVSEITASIPCRANYVRCTVGGGVEVALRLGQGLSKILQLMTVIHRHARGRRDRSSSTGVRSRANSNPSLDGSMNVIDS